LESNDPAIVQFVLHFFYFSTVWFLFMYFPLIEFCSRIFRSLTYIHGIFVHWLPFGQFSSFGLLFLWLQFIHLFSIRMSFDRRSINFGSPVFVHLHFVHGFFVHWLVELSHISFFFAHSLLSMYFSLIDFCSRIFRSLPLCMDFLFIDFNLVNLVISHFFSFDFSPFTSIKLVWLISKSLNYYSFTDFPSFTLCRRIFVHKFSIHGFFAYWLLFMYFYWCSFS
jgi:hypothetical protein